MISVTLEGISVSLDRYDILKDADASFPAGKTTFIMGKSGSGKSTLLKVAAGIIVPQRGSVAYDDRSLARMSRSEEKAFRRQSAFAFQDGALWSNQTIYNNLYLPLAFHEPGIARAEADRRIESALGRVGYDESRTLRPAELSAGEQKLVSIARSLILDPTLLFMDEPTTSLDNESGERIVVEMAARRESGITLVVVSHSTRVIAMLADYICVVADGKVVDCGEAEAVAQRQGGELLRRFKTLRQKPSSIDGAGPGA